MIPSVRLQQIAREAKAATSIHLWPKEAAELATSYRCWQPIESGPRDGTHILVTAAHGGGLGHCGPMNAHGFRGLADWCDVVHWFDDPDEPGFYSTSWGGDQEHPFENLTHWMPLPEAPAK